MEWIKRHKISSVLAFVLLIVLIAWNLNRKAHVINPATLVFADVKKGDLTIKIVESGTLRSLNSVILGSEIRGNQAKIVKLIPEGTYVEKGDLLVQFDETPFEDDIVMLKTEIKEAKAMLEQTKKDLKLQIAKNEDEIKTAEHQVLLLGLELRDVLEGVGVVEEKELKVKVEEAERVVAQAENEYNDFKEMYDKGFINRDELDKARLNLLRASSELSIARLRFKTHRDYTNPANIEKAKAELNKAGDELAQLKQTTYYQIARQDSIVKRAEVRLESAIERLKLTEDQLGKTKIYAPISGFVVYKEIAIGGERRKAQIGDSVWSHQGFILMPDLSKMIVDTRIREIDIHRVKPAQSVRIWIDAYPDLRLKGQVDLIGTLASQDDNSIGKYFHLRIALDDNDYRLRPGMTARVEILVDRLKHVLYIPVGAVFEKEGKTICRVKGKDGPEQREIQAGKSNEDYVEVKEGLAEGEKVYLTRSEVAP